MPDEPNAYRDALAAAHARIEQLEREAKASDPRAARLASLLRERARVVTELEPVNRWPWVLKRFSIPCAVVAIAFAVDRDWILLPVVIALPFALAAVAQAISNGSAKAAAKQLELLDAAIAKEEQRAASAAAAPPF